MHEKPLKIPQNRRSARLFKILKKSQKVQSSQIYPTKAHKTTIFLHIYAKKIICSFAKIRNYEAVDSIIKAALEYYDSAVNYDEYDLNGDNYIDSIYLVYTAPIDYQSDDSLYWAFSSQYFTNSKMAVRQG